MTTTKQLNTYFQERLQEEFIRQEPQSLYDPINYLLEVGGKRIRPLLCLIACEMFGGDKADGFWPAVAVEFFHNFTLMHDDIMDEAPLRRGRETVHLKYGLPSAILSGDVMLVKSYQFLEKCPVALQPVLYRHFSQVAVDVCEGQQMDMNFETMHEVSVEEYIQMISLKTSVLLGCSLRLGALVGGASAEEAAQLYEYGKNAGIAFQLKDDLLDVYAAQEDFGKIVGGDIIRNKKTFLLLKALELAEGKYAQQLDFWLHEGEDMPDKKVEEVTKIYNALSIKELAEQEINKYYQKALQAMDSLTIDPSRKTILNHYMEAVMNRKY